MLESYIQLYNLLNTQRERKTQRLTKFRQLIFLQFVTSQEGDEEIERGYASNFANLYQTFNKDLIIPVVVSVLPKVPDDVALAHLVSFCYLCF